MFDSASKYKSNMPTCSVCKFQYDAYYRIPRVIPKCGHTFCQKCIISSLQVKANRKIFICPDCQTQTVIRKSPSQDIPVNVGILEIAKNIKKLQYEDPSPLRLKSPAKDSPSKQKFFCKLHPNKQLDLVCQTCNFQKVCSICALISNNHNEHKFVQFIPASKFDLNEVKQVFGIIQDTVKMTILPDAEQNIIKKTEQTLVNKLITLVKENFHENYYKIIEKKQNELISQVKEIKFEGGISKKIEQIAKNYDMLKNQYSQIFRKSIENKNTALQTVEDFIQKCKNLHNQVELFSEHAQTKMKTLLKEISIKINQSSFFRISQLPISLKQLLSERVQVTSPLKFKSQASVSQIKKRSVDLGMKSSSRGERSNSKREQDIKSIQNISFDAGKKPFTVGSINNVKKSSFMPPKQKINKIEGKSEKRDDETIPILQINSKIEENKHSTLTAKTCSNTERLNKSSIQNIKEVKKSVQKDRMINTKLNFSQISKYQQQNQDPSSLVTENQLLKLRQVRPSKQIPLNLKAKFSAITKQIVRQSGSQSLQLIGMQICDSLIVYVCDYLKSKRLKFSMIKLVKNNLTDDGLSILLGHLANDDTIQVLNMTSNQLTSKCLDLFIEIGQKNSFLKTIYLSHNKVSSIALKQKTNQLSNLGLELII